ncbi:hypothetical protein J4216_04715 [Candidatus Woesearchaeota archaeon]|nr:hypothetical protein [Candidatus Woesearchaeota archaeon]
MKAQAATEYLILISIILIAIIPLFYYALSESNRTTRINQASSTVNSIARKSESIYALGSGSRDFIWISIPSGVNTSLVDNGTISLSMPGTGDVSSFTNINISGSIPINQGIHRISIEMLNDVVVIGPVNDTTLPQIIDTQPKGIVTINNPTLEVTTDEPSACKYDSIDRDYNSMLDQMNGTGLSHNSKLTGLSNGNYTYYVRCIDRFQNVMSSSSVISFSVVLDTTAPSVSNTQVDKTNLSVNEYICINATVSDAGTIHTIWAKLTTPLNSPFPSEVNYVMSDTASCAGTSNDNVYGISIQLQAAGNWTINTIYANDTANNLGYENPYPNITIVVSPIAPGPGNDYEYKVPDIAWNFKTPNGVGITARDDQSTLTLNTIELSDEDKNTPPSSSKFYYTSNGQRYEGFILQLNRNKSEYEHYSLRLKAKSAQTLPYDLRVYAYSSDDQNIILTNTTDFSITNVIITGVDRGFNEVNITDTVLAGNSTYIKIRIAPRTTMNGDTAQITEADIGVVNE